MAPRKILKGTRAIPKKNPNKPKRRQWQCEAMKLAMAAVNEGKMGLRKASQIFKVPRSTLQDRLHGRHSMDAKLGAPTKLKATDEVQLVDYACNRASLGIGFGKKQFLKYAGDLAHKRGVVFKNGQPSEKWWRLCKKRQHTLVHRRPEATASIRHKQMNRQNVAAYFKALREVIEKNNFQQYPSRIWNMDETGMHLDHVPRSILAKKGSHTVQSRTTGKSEPITVIATVNADGSALPPHFIVKGKTVRCLQGYDVGSAPPNSHFSSSDSGWTKNGIALLWFQNVFLKNIGNERPQMLLFDGHDSHNFVEIINAAIEENIILVEMPSHTSHWLQPLDRSVFAPLKEYYRNACQELMNDPAVSGEVNKANFCRLFTTAWVQAMSESNIKAGFRACGVHPLNPGAIPDAAYFPNYLHSSNIDTIKTRDDGQQANKISNVEGEVEVAEVIRAAPMPITSTELIILAQAEELMETTDEDQSDNLNALFEVTPVSEDEMPLLESNEDEIGPVDTIEPVLTPNVHEVYEGNAVSTSQKEQTQEINNSTHRPTELLNETMLTGSNPMTADNKATESSLTPVNGSCSAALALHALNMALGGDKVGKYKSFLNAGIDVPNDNMFTTWKRYYKDVQNACQTKNKATKEESTKQPKPATITSHSFYKTPLREKQAQILQQFTNTSSPKSPDNDILSYPTPPSQTKSTTNQKKYGKFFILTADEAVASKRKAAELKNEKERLKEERKKKREQAKENKPTIKPTIGRKR